MRLIDADALVNNIKEEASANYCNELYGVSNGLRIAETFVNDAPTIDPVKRGHWDYSQSEIVGSHYHEVINCSCCGWTYDRGFVGLRFCPNCGAKMDEVEDD